MNQSQHASALSQFVLAPLLLTLGLGCSSKTTSVGEAQGGDGGNGGEAQGGDGGATETAKTTRGGTTAKGGTTAAGGATSAGGQGGTTNASSTTTSCCTLTDPVHCRCIEANCIVAAVDADGDTFGTTACVAAPGTDCDDSKSAINPGATEVCDLVDNDCDGKIDIFDGLGFSTLEDSLTSALGPHDPVVVWSKSHAGFIAAYDTSNERISTRLISAAGVVMGNETAFTSGDLEPYGIAATDTQVLLTYLNYTTSPYKVYVSNVGADLAIGTWTLATSSASLSDGAVMPLGNTGTWAAAVPASSATTSAYVYSVNVGEATLSNNRSYTGYTKLVSATDPSNWRTGLLASTATTAQLQIRGSALAPTATVNYADISVAQGTAIAAGGGQFLVLLHKSTGWYVDLVSVDGVSLCASPVAIVPNVAGTTVVPQSTGGRIGNYWVVPAIETSGTNKYPSVLVLTAPCSGSATAMRLSSTACVGAAAILTTNIAIGPTSGVGVWTCNTGGAYERAFGPALCNTP